MCDPGESEREAKAWKTEDVCHTEVTSRNGCLKAWSETRETHGITLEGEDVPHGRLIIISDGTAKEEKRLR